MNILFTVWQLKEELHCAWAVVGIHQDDLDTYKSTLDTSALESGRPVLSQKVTELYLVCGVHSPSPMGLDTLA